MAKQKHLSKTVSKKYIFFFFVILHGHIYPLTLWEKYPVDFYESMSNSKFFDVEFARNDSQWLKASQAYERGMRKEYTHDTFKIPPVFHLVWLGSKVPQAYWKLKESLEMLHPGFSVIVWDDEKIKTISMINRDKFDLSKNYGEKSDIARYEILYQYGGVYLDGDFFIFQSMTELFYVCDLFCGCLYDRPFAVANGLIGAVPRHPLIQRCIDTISKAIWDGDRMKVMGRTGPYLFSRLFIDEYTTSRIDIALPVGFLYPLPYYVARAGQGKFSFDVAAYRKPYSIAMQKWEASWIQ